MAALGTGAGPPVVNVYHEKSRILPDVSRVLACLYEKDVKFETIKASYKDLLSLQASRSVPVPFYDGPVFLQDSRAICRYIAETYEHQGYPFLLGKDVLERASIEQWLRHEEHAFDPPSRALFCHLAFPSPYEDDDDHEDINQETRKLEEVLYDSRKNVQSWWNKISARDSWQQVLRDMKTVEEQHELEKQRELEEQQRHQLLTAPSPTFGGHDIRIDPRKQEGTAPHTVLVAPPSPSTGTVSTTIPPASQEPGTTSDQKPFSPHQRKQGGFFTPPEQPPPPSTQTESATHKSPISDNSTKTTFFTPSSTPTTPKAYQRTDARKFSNKDAPSPTEKPPPPSRPTDPTTQKTPSSDVVFTDKAPDKIDEPNSSETESKSTGVSPQVDKPVPSINTAPDTQTPQTPYVKPPEHGGTDTSVGAEPGQAMKSIVHPASTPSKRDTPDVIDDDNRFSTKSLRAVFNPDIEDSQYPSKQEEAPADPKKSTGLHDREKKTTMIPDSGKYGGSPSPDTQAPYAPVTDEERSAILPPKGRTATTRAEKSPSNQQVPHASPSTDKLAKIASVNTGTPQGTTPKTPTDDRNGSTPVHGADPSTIVTSDEPSEKSSTMGKNVLEATPRKTTPAENRGVSAPVEEVTLDGHVKQRPAGRREILDVQGTGDGDSTQKPFVDKRAAEPSSRKTIESDKEAGRTLQGLTGDEPTKAAQPAPGQAPASGEQNTAVAGGGTLDTLDANGKEAVTPSPGDPRGALPTTPGRLAPIPDTRNEKTVIAETSETSTEAPNENSGRRVPRNARESSSGPSPVKLQEHVYETYKEQDDRSGDKLVENKMRQGNNVASNAKTGEHKEDDYIANANNNNNRKAQAITADAPSKLQIQSGKNKPETSKDGDMGIKETGNSRLLEKSREVQPSSPETSMGQKQLQENRSAESLQGNVKKSTDAPPLGSGTEQQKMDDLPTEEDKNSGKAPEVR